MNDNLLEVRELILVGGRDGDDLSSRRQVLRHAARVTAVLIQSNKLRNFVVFIDQIDRQPSVVVQRVSCTVLSTQHDICLQCFDDCVSQRTAASKILLQAFPANGFLAKL